MKLSEIEFSEYSQNGEDGIIAWLIGRLRQCATSFVEIGSGSGKQNNTTRLAMRPGWRGVVIDRREKSIENYKKRNLKSVAAHAVEVFPENAAAVLNLFPLEPDLFSLDIDGHDYHVLQRFMELGFRPQIIVCEYNSGFGDAEIVTAYGQSTAKLAGCSLMSWRRMLEKYGYLFVTVESRRLNAFFVRKGSVDAGLQFEIEWLDK